MSKLLYYGAKNRYDPARNAKTGGPPVVPCVAKCDFMRPNSNAAVFEKIRGRVSILLPAAEAVFYLGISVFWSQPFLWF